MGKRKGDHILRKTSGTFTESQIQLRYSVLITAAFTITKSYAERMNLHFLSVRMAKVPSETRNQTDIVVFCVLHIVLRFL